MGAQAGDGRQARRGARPLADSRINRDGLPAGTPAPPFRAPRLDGGALSLDDFRGRRILLVFADPACGPCDELAPRLEALHRSAGDPSVVMLGRGDPAANLRKVMEHGLTFPVALQQHWEISRAYGIFATPVGYLIDERGRIATDVAIGVDAILRLAQEKGSAMRPLMQARLLALRKELETGQLELLRVEARQASLRETMLRISGAIHVLEELLANAPPEGRDGPPADQPPGPPEQLLATPGGPHPN